jgi:GTP 3',8-cyclase
MQLLIPQSPQPVLADPLGRGIGYLRLSLTAACSMRCTYCRPKVMDETDKGGAMPPATIERVVRHLVRRWGVTKVRLTGGEPTARPDLIEIIRRISGIDGLEDLAMTTNGLTLPHQAAALRQAGLHRLNVSLDSLRPHTFERMTGVRGPDRVLEGIRAALSVGLAPLKLNTVVLAGENEAELPELVRFAAEHDVEIRFIELMPMGPLADQWADRYVPEATMRRRLERIVLDWRPLEQGHSSARRFEVLLDDGRRTTVGFITPMSCNFCAACNRLRLTSNGDVYPCLMDRPRGNILSAVAPQFDAERFDQALMDALQAKAPEHPINGFTTMTVLGG